MTAPPSGPAPRRAGRRKRLLLAAAATLAVVAIALPSLLSTQPARTRIVARINDVLAPGFLEVGSLQLRWWGETRLDRVALLDPAGRVVVKTPTAILDRGLWHLLVGGLRGATLTLDDADLDVERAADGTVNLGRALSSLLAHPDPRRDLRVRIARGTLRYRDPALAEPIAADAVELDLRLPSAPNPVEGTLRLGRGDETLEASGSLDRWSQKGRPGAPPEIRLDLRAERWAWTARAGGVDVAGRWDGTVDISRKRGRWKLAGDARLSGVEAAGGPLRGDTFHLDQLAAGWDLDQSDAGWTVRRLGVNGDFGTLQAEGSLAAGGRKRIEGRLDLAAIARQLPHALRLRDGLRIEQGVARLEVTATNPAVGVTAWDGEARIADLAALDGTRRLALRDPATLSARVVEQGGAARLERASARTAFLDASGQGTFAEGVAITGSLDLARLRDQMGDWIDLGKLAVAGRVALDGRWQSRDGHYEAGIEARGRDLRVDGTAAGPIARDEATFTARLAGPASDGGWPASVATAGFTVDGRGPTASLDLAHREAGRWGVRLRAAGPASVGGEARSVKADVEGEWEADRVALRFGSSRLTLSDAGGGSRLDLAFRGRYDHAAGALALEPDLVPAADPSTALAIAPEGVRVQGIGRGLAELHASAQFESGPEAVARALGRPAGAGPGRGTILVRVDGDGDGVQVAARVGVEADTAAGGRGPTLTTRARYDRGADRLDVAELTLASPYGAMDAAGKVDGLGGRREVDLRGTIAPDFAALSAWMAAHVEPGAKVAGRPRPFRVAGTLAGPDLNGIDAEAGVDLDELAAFGLHLGSTPILVRARGGSVAVEPISTTLNEGHIRLEPELDRSGPDGPTLRLGKNSTIRDAKINDEVSRRVLAYVAPVLEDATTVTGRVSVDLDHAEIPLTAGRSRATRLEGAVVFSEVEFAPGALADQMLQAAGRRDARLRLDQPVTLTIADGRVNQRGLSVPIGGLTRVDVEGWVGFDRRMSLKASLPVTPAMLGDNPLLSDIAAGTRVTLPVGGTLDRPEVDRDALNDHLKELGKSLLTRGATRGAIEIIRRLAQPRSQAADPNAEPAPPRLTPQERRALRREKQAERRGQAPP